MQIKAKFGRKARMFLILSTIYGCDIFRHKTKSFKIGFLTNETPINFSEVQPTLESYISSLTKCNTSSSGCNFIKSINHLSSKTIRINLENSNKLDVLFFTDETIIANKIKNHEIEAIFGLNSWEKAVNLVRKTPGLVVKTSSVKASVTILSNIPLPDFLSDKRFKKIFHRQLELKSKKQISSIQKIKDKQTYITSIDKSEISKTLARAIKLTDNLRKIPATLVVEPNSEFKASLEGLLKLKKPFIRITNKPPKELSPDTELTILQLKLPIVSRKRLNTLFK